MIGYCNQDFSAAPYPAAVTGVVAKMAARTLLAAANSGGFVQQQMAGSFMVQYSSGAASGDVWLTASDKLALRPYRLGGGLTSVQLVGERYEIQP